MIGARDKLRKRRTQGPRHGMLRRISVSRHGPEPRPEGTPYLVRKIRREVLHEALCYQSDGHEALVGFFLVENILAVLR